MTGDQSTKDGTLEGQDTSRLTSGILPPQRTTDGQIQIIPELAPPLQAIETFAEDKAQEDASNDLTDDEENNPTESEILEKARRAWNTENRRTPEFTTAFLQSSRETTQSTYFEAYVRVYRQTLANRNVGILDEREGQIRKLAHSDKRHYADILLQEYLPYQAVLRVQPYTQQNPQEKALYLQELDGLVKTYVRYYDRHTPRPRRSDRSTDHAPFPDWQR